MTTLYPWLETYRQTIATALAQGRLPHALLLTGLQGVGKGVLAEAIAGQLLCPAATLETGPCGHCDACAQLNAGSHPDYLRIQPEEDSSVIKVDQIRLLAEKLSFSSHQGGYKVAVLNPAGNMNINAANSLLKTLEEPSDNTVLLLICERPSQLPATVRSRCQQIRVEVPGQDVALQWLAGQGISGAGRDLSENGARGATGSPETGTSGQYYGQTGTPGFACGYPGGPGRPASRCPVMVR